jgi:hypothetical protein
MRRALTDRQPYRCHACGVRTWAVISVPIETHEATPDDLRTGVSAKPITTTDLDLLDS